MEVNALTIRPADPEDAPALLAIYAPYVQSTAITFEYQVPTSGEFAARIRSTLEHYPYLVAQIDKTILGYAYAGPFQTRPAYGWAAEASIYVDQTARRSGIGRALSSALERTLSAQNILNLNVCIALPTQEKDPYLTNDSAAFHAHLGYCFVGRFHQCGYKFGRWYDMIWMEKSLGPHPDVPPAVIPFSELRKTL